MRTTLKLLLLIILILSFSCEDKGFFIICADCTSEEPLTADLEIKLDVNYTSKNTVINIYEGNLEDSILYSSHYPPIANSLKVSVSLNKKYTVTATYNISDNYYTAIDSATPRVRYDEDQCTDPCYFVYDKSIDLRLKYTK